MDSRFQQYLGPWSITSLDSTRPLSWTSLSSVIHSCSISPSQVLPSAFPSEISLSNLAKRRSVFQCLSYTHPLSWFNFSPVGFHPLQRRIEIGLQIGVGTLLSYAVPAALVRRKNLAFPPRTTIPRLSPIMASLSLISSWVCPSLSPRAHSAASHHILRQPQTRTWPRQQPLPGT